MVFMCTNKTMEYLPAHRPPPQLIPQSTAVLPLTLPRRLPLTWRLRRRPTEARPLEAAALRRRSTRCTSASYSSSRPLILSGETIDTNISKFLAAEASLNRQFQSLPKFVLGFGPSHLQQLAGQSRSCAVVMSFSLTPTQFYVSHYKKIGRKKCKLFIQIRIVSLVEVSAEEREVGEQDADHVEP